MSVNRPLLARFLEEVATEEQLLLQRQRDLEGVPIREAIVGRAIRSSIRTRRSKQEMTKNLDLAAFRSTRSIDKMAYLTGEARAQLGCL